MDKKFEQRVDKLTEVANQIKHITEEEELTEIETAFIYAFLAQQFNPLVLLAFKKMIHSGIKK